jgi:hypothetical protein
MTQEFLGAETRDQVGLLFVAVMVFVLAVLKLREYRRSQRR